MMSGKLCLMMRVTELLDNLERKDLTLENIGTSRVKETINVSVAAKSYFSQILNLIQVVVGRVFSYLKIKILLTNLRTIHLV